MRKILSILLLFLGTSLCIQGQDYSEVYKAIPEYGYPGSVNSAEAGRSVAVDGDLAVVGASRFNSLQGMAYLLEKVTGNWEIVDTLLANDRAVFDNFGHSVAVSGTTIVVGAYGDDDKGVSSGSAYVFEYSNGTATQKDKITASDGAAYDNFGYSVAISGTTILVGAFADDSYKGAAYVFEYSNGAATQKDKITASDGAAYDNFGYSVAISGTTILVGAYGVDSYKGAAYVFEYSNGAATQKDKITASNGAAYDHFGYSVAISGTTIVVGAYGDDSYKGAAYVFEYSNGAATQKDKITASDGVVYDYFGHSVAISGTTIVVGAYEDDSYKGAAYVFEYSNGAATQQDKITASDGVAYDYFGYSVAVSGTTIVVGANGDDDKGNSSGSAYVLDYSNGSTTESFKALPPAALVFDNIRMGSSVAVDGNLAVVSAPGFNGKGMVYLLEMVASSWEIKDTLLTNDGASGDEFGHSVAISGTSIVVGAYRDNDKGFQAGSAYVFEYSNGTATQKDKITASDGAAYDYFGHSVAISGTTIVVGAYGDDSYKGAAYVFEYSNGTATQKDKITASDGAASDNLGYSVAISGTTIVVSAPYDNDKGFQAGSAYVFEYSNGTASQQDKITASDGAANDFFGYSVAISGTTIVVGAYLDDDKGGDSGSAYVFEYSNGTATQQDKITASDGAGNDQFGYSVAISGTTIVVGAYLDGDKGASSGSAYVFEYSTGAATQQDKITASDGAAFDNFGYAVSVSGTAIVVGALYNDDKGSNSGSAYFFGPACTISQQTLEADKSICPGTATSIQLNGSETGITYTLKNKAADATVDGPTAGTGSTLSFNSGSLSSSTDFYIYAEDASDASCNLNLTDEISITVEDNVKPTAIAQTVTLSLDANGEATLSPGQVNSGSSDNCTAANDLTLSLSKTAFTCGDIGSESVTLTVEDASGNQQTVTATITIEDNVKPTAIAQAVTLSLDANGEATLSPSQVNSGSSDNCTAANDLTLSLSKTAFTCADIGSESVTLTVEDASGNKQTASATITVEDNIAPVAKAKNIEVALDPNGTVAVNATDLDNGSTDNCSGLNFSLDVSSFDCDDLGDNAVVFTATDAGGNSHTANATITVVDNLAPVIATKNITVQLDANGEASISVADVDNGTSDNCTPTNNLQLSLSKTSFSCADAGLNNLSFTAIDEEGNEGTANVEVTVQDNSLPIAKAKNVTIYLDANGNASTTAQEVDNGSGDNCGGANGVTLGLSETDFTCFDRGNNTVWLYAEDASGNKSSARATVSVLDTVSPTASAKDLTVYLNANGQATASPTGLDLGSTDNCTSSNKLQFSLSKAVFTCEDLGTNTILFYAKDQSGNKGSTPITVTVLDTRAPDVATKNFDLQLNAQGQGTLSPEDIDDNSTDNCSIVSKSLTRTQFTCADVGVQVVTLTVTDQSGNSASHPANVNVLAPVSGGTEVVEACVSYFWAASNQTYTNTGNYNVVLENQYGCDSTATLDLTIHPNEVRIIFEDVCDSYTWESTGLSYNESGVYTYTGVNRNGCDSIINLDLTIRKSTSHTINAATCTFYTSPSGKIFTTEGTHMDTIDNAAGCDSVLTINLLILDNEDRTIEVSACDSYTSINNNDYTQTGVYTEQIQTQDGCDIQLTIDLTIRESTTHSFSVTACDEYVWNNISYTSTGSYTQSFTNAAGCDSTVTLDLTINSSETISTAITSCKFYKVPSTGEMLTQSGVYTINHTNRFGCDSTETLTLTIPVESHKVVNASECESYYWSETNTTYNETGSHTVSYEDQFGCDSTITLNLTIYGTNITEVDAFACTEFESPSGKIWVESGLYRDTVKTINGCDSVLIIDLTVQNPQDIQEEIVACHEYITPNGSVIKESGIYNEIRETAENCSYNVVMDITINPIDTTFLEVKSCNAYLWYGEKLGESGTYYYTATNQYECDSVLILNLDLSGADRIEESATACGSYVWDVTGDTLYTTDVYKASFKNAYGCDSIYVLNLEIPEMTASIRVLGDSLFVEGDYDRVYWIDCDKGAAMVGENNDYMHVTSSGNYAAVYSKGNCSDTTECVNMTISSIFDQSPSITAKINVYPNPSYGQFAVKMEGVKAQDLRVWFTDAAGRRLSTSISWSGINSGNFNLGEEAAGVYFIHFQDQDGAIQVQKLVKW